MAKYYHTIFRANSEPEIVPFTIEEEEAKDAQILANIWLEIRKVRDNMLSESDVFVYPDRWETYTTAKKTSWRKYRQELRDLPETITDPFNVTWPTKPE